MTNDKKTHKNKSNISQKDDFKIKLRQDIDGNWILDNADNFSLRCNNCWIALDIENEPLYACQKYNQLFCMRCAKYEPLGQKHFGAKEKEHIHLKISAIAQKTNVSK